MLPYSRAFMRSTINIDSGSYVAFYGGGAIFVDSCILLHT